MEWIRNQLNYDGLYVVDCACHSGGLALLWTNTVKVSILGSSTNYIDAHVTIDQVGSWRFTGFYGCPERNRRNESWAMLKNLSKISQLPWILLGDFNDILRAGFLK